MFSELIKNEPITWEGKFTQSLTNQQVYPQMSKN